MTAPLAESTAAGAGWTQELRRARLHFVTGKGGTGKTTVAAALALALATGGRKVLLVEVEGRQGIAQLFDTEPMPYEERHLVAAPGDGEIRALNIDAESALLEYFQMFYNLGFAGRTLRRMGAIEFATTLAPGLRDVLLTGKIKEVFVRDGQDKRQVYDHIVVDAPPTGRIVKFLDVTRALTDLTKGSPIKAQSEDVVKVMRSTKTAVHVVTLLEEMPVRETIEAIKEISEAGLRPGAVLVNRVRPERLPERSITAAADGRVDSSRVRKGLESAGLALADDVIDGLVAETVEHAIRVETERSAKEQLAEVEQPMIELPDINDGIDVAALYELAEVLDAKGVR